MCFLNTYPVYACALTLVPVTIHVIVNLRVYACVFVWKLSSGKEHVLYESPRWKRGQTLHYFQLYESAPAATDSN
jgi:hypothetical protein